MCSNFGNDKCKEFFDLECPYCHEHLYCNKRTYANHLRWCKSNPKYEEILNSTKRKCSENNANKVDKKIYTFVCEVCGKEYQLELSENSYNKGKYKRTCSNECAKKLTAKNTNKIEKNNKISKSLEQPKKQFTCKYCGKKFNSKKYKKYCSRECSSKYKKLERSLYLYSKGKVLQLYKEACNFTFSLKSFPNEFNFSLIEEFGWYKAKNKGNNLNGVSRDHKISKQYGFDNLIDPYIISHPANCELIQQNENSSKKDKCSISINNLLNNIQNWNKIYGIYPNKIEYTIFDKVGIHFNIKYNMGS